MTLAEAIKQGLVLVGENDMYLTMDGRILTYDRYYQKARSRRPSNMWIDEKGNVFYNFNDAYYCVLHAAYKLA